MPSLCPAALDHLLAIGCTHALQESVRRSAFAAIRLISSLHGYSSLKTVKRVSYVPRVAMSSIGLRFSSGAQRAQRKIRCLRGFRSHPGLRGRTVFIRGPGPDQQILTRVVVFACLCVPHRQASEPCREIFRICWVLGPPSTETQPSLSASPTPASIRCYRYPHSSTRQPINRKGGHRRSVRLYRGDKRPCSRG
jgi:hypothetical protein